jgi:multidrug efflux pump subunit AcrA (membrane-fusion protein)
MGYMRTIADPDQVSQLDRQLVSLRRRAASHVLPNVENIPATVDYDQLGELQNSFVAFKKAQAAYLLANQMPNDPSPGRGLMETVYSESYLQGIDVLRNEVSAWTRDNSFSAPVAGKVVFASPLYVGQTVKADEPIFYVAPKIESSEMYGEAKLTQDQANKLRVGRSVTVRLPGYFTGEKGLMAGKIIFISEIPTADGAFSARIALPKPPHSAYGSNTAYRPGMQAIAEVTVGNPRALERLLVAVSE